MNVNYLDVQSGYSIATDVIMTCVACLVESADQLEVCPVVNEDDKLIQIFQIVLVDKSKCENCIAKDADLEEQVQEALRILVERGDVEVVIDEQGTKKYRAIQ